MSLFASSASLRISKVHHSSHPISPGHLQEFAPSQYCIDHLPHQQPHKPATRWPFQTLYPPFPYSKTPLSPPGAHKLSSMPPKHTPARASPVLPVPAPAAPSAQVPASLPSPAMTAVP
eukprot:IDg8794t1